jgi:hypothetical protein
MMQRTNARVIDSVLFRTYGLGHKMRKAFKLNRAEFTCDDAGKWYLCFNGKVSCEYTSRPDVVPELFEVLYAPNCT